MIKSLIKPTKTKRTIFFLVSDFLIFALSFYFSFLLRFDFNIPQRYENIIPYWIPVFVFSKIFIFWILKIYQINWRFVSLNEFFKIVIGTFSFSLVIFFINMFLQVKYTDFSIPRSVIFIDFFVSLFLVSLIRISKRVYLEILQKGSKGKRTLIIGAGNTGERIVRELKRNSDFYPVCFVDDDPMKIGTTIHNIPVIGSLADIPEILKENRIETVIIAIPSLNHKKIREIFDLLSKEGIKDIKIVPSLSKLPKESISVKDLKEISIEDLLSREPVEIEKDKIKKFLKNKKILVSGAGGSIGSEVIRQLIEFSPKSIIALEIDETELYNLFLELKDKTKEKSIDFIPVVADVRDREKIKRIFQEYKPDIVFHAAAYKHVPLMEFFPEEAVRTNIFGTYNMVLASIESNVEKFINISTDKAVNPTSIMGATKRMAEMICNAFNSLNKTKFVSVRFGNVLGSRGSVIPIFLEQIKKGGPITVTHPEMKRYFMTIPEAVLLVFQAATMGKGGEVFVLDMGEPVKIVKLAEELIKLQGLQPYEDIDIVFTGLRPGEKLFEELLTAEEGTEKTYHKKVFIAKISKNLDVKSVEKFIEEIKNLIYTSPSEIKNFLKKYIPFYNEGDNNKRNEN
ncbi:MAG: polysaccharide biosynthesis protein [Hydrogenothermus sp.]|nr:MAG: polysaccharide biosynthesis protein [Hydrogenothermus sp.]